MGKPAGWTIGQWIGIGASIALAGAGVVALRHALETPQPLKSALPGEAHLYQWRRRSIFYKVAGPSDAPALVLLHRPDPGVSGHEMLHIMAPLAVNYRVYALDLLGFGLSDRPGIEYSADIYSALCEDFLREVVQKPAILLASGLSCNYAITAAAHAPELSASLVLISPFALQGEAAPSLFKQYLEKPPVKALLYPLLSTHLAFLMMRQDGPENQEDFAQFYASTHQLGAEHAAMARLAGKLTVNSEQAFEALRQPILMIWGTHALDHQPIVAGLHRTATLANPARQTRKVELIQQAALSAHIEQPAAVVAAIQHWQAALVAGEISSTTTISAIELPAVEADSSNAATFVDTPEPALMQSKGAYNGTPQARAASTQEDKQSRLPETSLEEETRQTNSPTEAEVPTSAASPGTTQQEREPEIIAYCVKCKQKRAMVHPQEVTMKNGRPALRGVCPVCGTRLNRIGGVN